MAKILIVLAIISCAFATVKSQSEMAAGLAGQASSSNKRPGQPIYGLQGGGGGNNARNWGAGGTVGLGTKVWESRNGRHSFGAGVAASQQFGRHQGQSWHTRPSYGVGGGYTYRFGKK